MLETTIKIPKQLEELNGSLKALSNKPSFDHAQTVINHVIALLGIETSNAWKPFNDSQGKIRSNAKWFKMAEGFADKRAAYKIADNNPQNIDLKCYWMKNLSKSVISWIVALTPNFEDEPFWGHLNVGIDFIIPEAADRVLVVLSKNYVIRTVELKDALSVTQQDVFNAWLTDFDFSNKAQVHEILWNSFDLEPVNKSFYKGISSFFVELKQFLAEDAKIFDDKHAAYFTNRLIGRIVFCWFLDKKGIINPEVRYFDVGDLTASEYYHLRLETLFFKVLNTPIDERDESDNDPQKKMFPELAERNIFNMDVDFKTPFLNGGLFEIKDNDKFERPDLTFPNDYFDRLFQFLRHYNFTTDESTATFQQVAIDPEMLGRIFENLLAEQVEETGEQARKAKGAFYTPREIVDYMCRESIREYLKSKIPEDELRDQRIGLLLDVKPHEFRDQQRNYRSDLKPYKYDILKALDELKIIDPACGSGAFPIGMLHLLLDIYDRLDATFDPYKKKIEVIKNNLYGVDIEPMAVEICRLRAWLSIIVDEESDSKKIEPLPNLDFKFICANSLIPLIKENGGELFDTIDQDELIEIRDKYFNSRTLKSKETLKKRFEKKIDYNGTGNMYSSNREKQLRSYHPFDSENVSQFFDAEFMFGVKDGFDIVIGNPPYITVSLGKKQKSFSKEDIEKLTTLYSDIKEYKNNTFSYFIRCAFNLQKNKGLLCYIVPNVILYNKNFSRVRSYMLTFSRIKTVLDIKSKVFQSAEIGGNAILILSKQDCKKSSSYEIQSKIIENISEFSAIDYVFICSDIFRKAKENRFYLNTMEFNLLHKLGEGATCLGELAEFYNGIKTGNNKKFLSDEKKSIKFKPALRGRDVHRYGLGSPKTYVLFDKENLWSNTNEEKLLKNPKIIIRQTGDSLIAALDTKGMLHMDSTHSIFDSEVNLYYILALLNSSVMNWWHRAFTSEEGRTFAEVKIATLKQMPVKVAKIKEVDSLVQKILSQKEKDFGRDTSDLEEQINKIFLDIYEITNDEKKIILGRYSEQEISENNK